MHEVQPPGPRPKIDDWKNPDYSAVWKYRNNLLDWLRANPDEWTRLFAYYRTHPVDAIEDWVVTYDPRLASEGKNPYIPLILFPKQRELVEWIIKCFRSKEEGIVEKSRDAGATWICLAVAWILWFLQPGVKIAFGSRVERLVDKIGDPDSILEKLRIMIDRLPREMQPRGWDKKVYAPYMKIINPENGSTITGEGGRNIGRGGRSSLYFIDEAAFLEYPDEAERALSENTDAKIWVSTPNGTGNPFYRKRFSGNFPVFPLEWRDDPRKDAAWYAKKVRTLEPETLAQEVDLDYEASAGDVVCPAKMVRVSQLLRAQLAEEGLLKDVELDAGIGGLDIAAGGKNKTVFVPRYGPLVGPPITWSEEDSINIAGRTNELARLTKCLIVKYDSVGVGKGVTSALRRMPDIPSQGINPGDGPTKKRWPDGKRAKDKFLNLRAEMMWEVREALRRTYEHWLFINGDGGVEHELSELLLLPDHSKLCAELSLPRYFFTTTGKIQIESKKQMAARGIASPDHADALVLTYAPRPVRRGSNRTVGLV